MNTPSFFSDQSGTRRRQPSAPSTARKPIAALIWALALLGSAAAAQDRTAVDAGDEPLARWRYYQQIPLPDQDDSPWYDLLLRPDVFDGARQDLGDLRLYDATPREVPYALRVRRSEFSREAVEARDFNRIVGPDQSRQWSLDLGEEPGEHNEVELDTPGRDFRRLARVEGSDDAQQWRLLAERPLVHFPMDDRQVVRRTVEYSPSRFRYLRVQVYPDPLVDEEPVEIERVQVYRRVELPGEYLTLDARLDDRQPVRVEGAPGSAWVLDLGGQAVPCEQILVDVATEEFVRDYWIEAGGPPELDEPFRTVARGVWRRRAGERQRPLVAEFSEVRAARLRLRIADHRNPPLEIRGAQYRAPARQVVFARSKNRAGPVRLYLGNPQAEAPRYDFARHLPERLEPPPERLKPEPRQSNPIYAPEPLPLTERWPWLIYLVLGLAVALLALLIANLARAAIAAHDQYATKLET